MCAQEIKMSEAMRALGNHGGRRSGAGRPEGSGQRDNRTATVKLRLHPDEKRELQRRAARRGQSVTEYLLSCSLAGKDDAVNEIS